MNKSKIKELTASALVAAMYVSLTWLSNTVGLASGAVQIRISEALCILPFFMPSTAWGLFIGCIISNLTVSAALWDIIFGSLATLVGALITSRIKNKYLAPLPTVIANTVVVPVVILYCYTEVRSLSAYLLSAAGVFAGEVISAYVFGIILLLALEKRKSIFK